MCPDHSSNDTSNCYSYSKLDLTMLGTRMNNNKFHTVTIHQDNATIQPKQNDTTTATTVVHPVYILPDDDDSHILAEGVDRSRYFERTFNADQPGVIYLANVHRIAKDGRRWCTKLRNLIEINKNLPRKVFIHKIQDHPIMYECKELAECT